MLPRTFEASMSHDCAGSGRREFFSATPPYYQPMKALAWLRKAPATTASSLPGELVHALSSGGCSMAHADQRPAGNPRERV